MKIIAFFFIISVATLVGNARAEDLHWAAKHNDGEIAELLIKSGADVNETKFDREAPLHWAAHNNSAGVATLLIDSEADVNAKDNKHWTPLHYAAWRNSVEVAKLLINNGAEIKAKTKKGETPLGLVKKNISLRKKIQERYPTPWGKKEMAKLWDMQRLLIIAGIKANIDANKP